MVCGGASFNVLLAYCYLAQQSMRRGMRKEDTGCAASLEFVLAKEKELVLWVA